MDRGKAIYYTYSLQTLDIQKHFIFLGEKKWKKSGNLLNLLVFHFTFLFLLYFPPFCYRATLFAADFSILIYEGQKRIKTQKSAFLSHRVALKSGILYNFIDIKFFVERI